MESCRYLHHPMQQYGSVLPGMVLYHYTGTGSTGRGSSTHTYAAQHHPINYAALYCCALVQFESYQSFSSVDSTKLMEFHGFCRIAAGLRLASWVFRERAHICPVLPHIRTSTFNLPSCVSRRGHCLQFALGKLRL